MQQAAGHVFTTTRVTFLHLVGWLKASIGDLCYRKLFMVGFLCRDDRGVCGQREVNVGIEHQVGTLSDPQSGLHQTSGNQ